MNDSKYRVLNRDMMKYLAITPMFIGHLIAWVNLMRHPDDSSALYLLPMPLLVLAGLSLFCPPVMFFFIADGYKYTRDRKKYALRLLIFALITQPFDWLIFQPINGWWTSNVIFTLFFGLLAIMGWESGLKLWQRVALVIICAGASLLLFSDWMVIGVLIIFFLHLYREQPKKRFIAFTLLILANTLPNLLSLGSVPAVKLIVYMLIMPGAFMLAYLCMTRLYNGKKGRHPTFAKWFFYGFYPAHYLVIYIVKLCLYGR